MRPLVPLALVLLLAPLALAQEHAHGSENGMSMVLYDGPPDGRALVGAYTHFGFALLDKDANPVPHQNAEFNVLRNGEVVFSTTDTHEYDGLFSLDLRFTHPGPYQVVAHSGDMELGVWEGIVHPLTEPTNATISFEVASMTPLDRVFTATLAILDENGELIPHSDAIVEIRDPGRQALYSRTHLHIHEEPIVFRQGLSGGLDYVAQVVGYVAFAEEGDPQVPAVVAEFPLSGGPLAVPGLAVPELAPPAALEQLGAVASADGLTLHMTYDPNNQVGVGQAARIAGLVTEDATYSPLAHVNFQMTLTGPGGLVFESESLHEYDGVFEYMFHPFTPGAYEGTLTASRGDVELAAPIRFLVLPPAVPLLGGMGPITLGVEGVDDIVAGVPQNLTFSAMGPAGPARHSEVDVTVFHDGEPPLYQFKLHTHDSGLTNAVLLFPHEGNWKIRIDGLPTVPEPSVYVPALVEFSVAPGLPGSGVPSATLEEGAAPVPGAWLALVLVSWCAATLMRRR